MSAIDILAAMMLAALTAYFLLGGADFGAGVWDLLASGPRKHQQRELIEKAIGPIWEANHVWLIFVVVLLFGAFPRAFSAVSIALHLPLTLFLIGVVFRGTAFVFRTYDANTARRSRWGVLFSIASVSAPMLLGMCVGAMASGEIRMSGGAMTSDFFRPWLRPFSFSVGVFAVALCALLAATYLTHEAPTRELQDDFKKRALIAGAVVAVCAIVSAILSANGAPRIFAGLTGRRWTWILHLGTAVSAVTLVVLLQKRRFSVARLAVGALTTLILVGWAASQYPLIIVPDVSLTNTAANPRTLRALVWSMAIGMPVLMPSLWLLFRVFKT